MMKLSGAIRDRALCIKGYLWCMLILFAVKVIYPGLHVCDWKSIIAIEKLQS